MAKKSGTAYLIFSYQVSIDQFFTRSPLSFHRVAQPRRERGAGESGGIDFFSFSVFFQNRSAVFSHSWQRGVGDGREWLLSCCAHSMPSWTLIPPPNSPSQHSDMQHCWLACLFPWQLPAWAPDVCKEGRGGGRVVEKSAKSLNKSKTETVAQICFFWEELVSFSIIFTCVFLSIHIFILFANYTYLISWSSKMLFFIWHQANVCSRKERKAHLLIT